MRQPRRGAAGRFLIGEAAFSPLAVIRDYFGCLFSSSSHFPLFADFYTVNWVCAAANGGTSAKSELSDEKPWLLTDLLP